MIDIKQKMREQGITDREDVIGESFTGLLGAAVQTDSAFSQPVRALGRQINEAYHSITDTSDVPFDPASRPDLLKDVPEKDFEYINDSSSAGDMTYRREQVKADIVNNRALEDAGWTGLAAKTLVGLGEGVIGIAAAGAVGAAGVAAGLTSLNHVRRLSMVAGASGQVSQGALAASYAARSIGSGVLLAGAQTTGHSFSPTRDYTLNETMFDFAIGTIMRGAQDGWTIARQYKNLNDPTLLQRFVEGDETAYKSFNDLADRFYVTQRVDGNTIGRSDIENLREFSNIRTTRQAENEGYFDRRVTESHTAIDSAIRDEQVIIRALDDEATEAVSRRSATQSATDAATRSNRAGEILDEAPESASVRSSARPDTSTPSSTVNAVSDTTATSVDDLAGALRNAQARAGQSTPSPTRSATPSRSVDNAVDDVVEEVVEGSVEGAVRRQVSRSPQRAEAIQKIKHLERRKKQLSSGSNKSLLKMSETQLKKLEPEVQKLVREGRREIEIADEMALIKGEYLLTQARVQDAALDFVRQGRGNPKAVFKTGPRPSGVGIQRHNC